VFVDGGPELLKDYLHFCQVGGGHSLSAELPYTIFQATKHKHKNECEGSQTGLHRLCRAANWLLKLWRRVYSSVLG
jgi:hypothetical protein